MATSKFGVAEDLMLTVEYEDFDYVHECLLGSTVKVPSSKNGEVDSNQGEYRKLAALK